MANIDRYIESAPKERGLRTLKARFSNNKISEFILELLKFRSLSVITVVQFSLYGYFSFKATHSTYYTGALMFVLIATSIVLAMLSFLVSVLVTDLEFPSESYILAGRYKSFDGFLISFIKNFVIATLIAIVYAMYVIKGPIQQDLLSRPAIPISATVIDKRLNDGPIPYFVGKVNSDSLVVVTDANGENWGIVNWDLYNSLNIKDEIEIEVFEHYSYESYGAKIKLKDGSYLLLFSDEDLVKDDKKDE